MNNKFFYILIAITLCVLSTLVFSQFIWLQQQVEKEKQAYQFKLKNNLENIVNFHVLDDMTEHNSKNIRSKSIKLGDVISEESSTPSDITLGSLEISTDINSTNPSLYKVLEDVIINTELENKRVNLYNIDSLFRYHFTDTNSIEAYEMKLSEKGKIIDSLYYYGGAKDIISFDSHNSIQIVIPLGRSNANEITANFRLKTIPLLGQMLYSISISAIAIILVALFMLWLLFKLHQKVNELKWREQAVSGIVHDLKSPVSYTYTFLDYLASKEQSEPMQKQFSNASTNIAKLSGKIDLILTLFRGNSVKVGLNPEPYPLAAKCEELLSELKVIYQNRQATCTMNIPEEIKAFVDPVYFEMALHNLLDNAFKYSETPAKIDIKATCSDKKLYIYISDSGKGIAPADQKKIFKQFYRAASSNRRGHGIGLSFSQQIIKAHKGEIKLQSNIGEGSTFCIVLPIKPKKTNS